MDTITEIIGWIGVVIGTLIVVPQLIKSIKEKSTKGVSKHSYQLLFFAVLCYLIRAIAIREPVFIASNSLGLVVTVIMLYLFKRYPGSD